MFSIHPYCAIALTVALLTSCATVSTTKETRLESGSALAPALEQGVGRTLKRKVAVVRFSNETRYGIGAFGGAFGVPIEKQASDILKAMLVESGAVILVDEEGLGDRATAATVIDANFAIIGSVSEFGRRNESNTGVFSRTKKQVVDAAVNLRVTDVRTGQTVYSETGRGSSDLETGRVFGIGQDAGYDSSLNDKAISAAISNLITNMLNNMLDVPWTTGVLQIEGETVMIAGGSEQGLRRGDTLALKVRGRRVANPQTGGEIELPRVRVATLEVVDFFGDGLTEGSICRLREGAATGTELSELVVESEGEHK